MPYIFGDTTITKILKGESHKLFESIEVTDNQAVITFSMDLVTSNTINITVDGVAISQVTFSGSHVNTMGLVATALQNLASVLTATVFGATNRKIKIVAASNSAPFAVISGVVAGGTQQAVITSEYNTNRTKIGQPLVLVGDGTVEPMKIENTTQQVIGIAMQDKSETEAVTIMMKAHSVIFAECETDTLVAGPVRLGTSAVYNATTGYVLVDDATVDHNDQIGWALEGGDDGDVIKVALL